MRSSPQFIVITAVTAIVATVLFAGSIGGDGDANASTSALVDGRIAFDSNRSGHSDVWVMDADGSNQVNLTLDQADPSYFARWSPDGTKIAYEVDVGDDNYDIWVMNADGSDKTGIAEAETLEAGPTWSPDGTKITYYDGDNVWVMNEDGTNRIQLTNNAEFSCCAEWHPDGTKMLFDAVRNGDRQIWMMNADGTNEVIQPGTMPGDGGVRYSPDGQMLTFGNAGDVYTMNANGTGRTNITNRDANEYSPAFTADGTRIVYTSEEFSGGTGQIVVMDLDGTNRVNLSNSGGYDAEPDVQWLIAATPTPTPTASPGPFCPGATAAPGATCPPCPGVNPAGQVHALSTCAPPPTRLWGDWDCDGEVSSRDNQALLRAVLSQAALSQTEPCPNIRNDAVIADGFQHLWGDSDCDGEISSRDNQALLRKVLSQAALSQTEPCPGIGDAVEVLVT